MLCVLFQLVVFLYPGNDVGLRSLCPILKGLFECIGLCGEEQAQGRNGWNLEGVSVGTWQDWALPFDPPVVDMCSLLTVTVSVGFCIQNCLSPGGAVKSGV